MTQTQQPEALRLAEQCDNFDKRAPIAACLRAQHARIQELELNLTHRQEVYTASLEQIVCLQDRIAELESQLEAVGAGGVEPLRKGFVRLTDVLARLEQGFGANSAPVTTIKRHFEMQAQPAQHAITTAACRAGSVYVSGPMTGYADWNFPAFNAAAAALRAQGLQVINPTDHGVVDGAEWADYLRTDLAQLAACERIHLLPGWSKSKGAKLELHVAQALGLQITLAEGAEPLGAAAPQAVQAEVPLFWVRLLRDGLYEGPVHNNSVGGKMLRDEKPGEWHPLYLHAAPAHPAEGVPVPMPVAHPHHCTARTADGSCEECEGHAQAMAEWNADRTALAATHPTQQGLEQDAARWRMVALISKEVMIHQDKRTAADAVSAYMHAVHSGLDIQGAIDAALAAQAKQGGEA